MIITRYLTTHLMKATFSVALILTIILLLMQSLKILDFIVNSNAPPSIFISMIFFSLPKFLEVILPLSLMASILFTYNRMISDNELIVMRACGVNQFSLALPALIVAGFTTILLLFISLWLTPKSHSFTQKTRHLVRTEYSSFLLRKGVFNDAGKNLTVYLTDKTNDGELIGLLIHDSRDKTAPPVTIMAKYGRITVSNDNPSITVYNGIRQQFNKKTQSLSRLAFQEYSLEISGLEKKVNERWRKVEERSFSELFNPDTSDKNDMKYKRTFLAEAHKRITNPLYALSFTFLALSCLLVGPLSRRGQTKRLVLAAVLGIALEGGALSAISLAQKNNDSIFLMYAFSILPVLIGWFMLTTKGEDLRRYIYQKTSKKQHPSLKKMGETCT